MSFKSDYTRPLGYIPYIRGRGKTAASYYLSSVFKPYPCVPAEIFGSEAEIVFVFGVRIGYDRFVGVSPEFFYQRKCKFRIDAVYADRGKTAVSEKTPDCLGNRSSVAYLVFICGAEAHPCVNIGISFKYLQHRLCFLDRRRRFDGDEFRAGFQQKLYPF